MPWNAASFKKRHNQGLSEGEASQASSVANAILRDTGDEGKAIRIANSQAKKKKRKHIRPEGMQHRAEGGEVEAGKKYVVGEKGSETYKVDAPGGRALPDLIKGAHKTLNDAMEAKEWAKTGGPPDKEGPEVMLTSEPIKPMQKMKSELKEMKTTDPGVQVIRGTKKSREYPGRQEGGPVEEGKSYTVGEKGPEVFVPKEDGKIIPHHGKKRRGPNRREGSTGGLRKMGQGKMRMMG